MIVPSPGCGSPVDPEQNPGDWLWETAHSQSRKGLLLDDLDRDRECHLGVELAHHQVLAQVLDRRIEIEGAGLKLDARLRPDHRDDVGRGDRAEQPAAITEAVQNLFDPEEALPRLLKPKTTDQNDRSFKKLERAKRFELSTVTLARWRSTN